MDQTRSEPGAHNTGGGALSVLSSVGDLLSSIATNQSKFADQIASYKTKLAKAVQEIASMSDKKGNRIAYSRALLATALI